MDWAFSPCNSDVAVLENEIKKKDSTINKLKFQLADSDGYWSNTVDLFHAKGGGRYMFNNKFGLQLDLGYDLISNDRFGKNGISLPFKSHYFRSSVQGVLDIGRVFAFENFTDRFSLLFHSGSGISFLTSKVNPKTDRMLNFLFGITPQYKLTERVSLNADLSFIWHIYQQYTFDMYNPVYNRGFDGFLCNASIGASIYIGKKKESHMDWAFSPCNSDVAVLENEIKKKDSTINKLKFQLADSDGFSRSRNRYAIKRFCELERNKLEEFRF